MKNPARSFALAAVLSACVPLVSAQAPVTPKAQFASDSKAALARYESDKKLCNEETTSSARLQCRRDAKQEYDAAVADAKARMDAAAPTAQAPALKAGRSTTVAAPPLCPDCGKVVAVSLTEKAGEGSAAGLVAGGVGGALLGRQIGSGSGRDLATIAGAVGGAYAGKKIEEKIKTHKVWNVNVQYPGGTARSFEFDTDPGFKVGDVVRNSGQSIVRE